MDAAERRAQRRAFIRANHPDAGGDAARFAAGLQLWDDPQTAAPPQRATDTARVHVIVRRSWPHRLVRGALRRAGRRGQPARVR